MAKTKHKLMIVAGEASGDAHAAKLVNELLELAGDSKIEFFGCAGPRMRDAGVEAIVDADNLAIVGVPEIVKALPRFLNAVKRLQNAAAERKPDAVILVDFPEFNLKLAKSLKKRGLKVIYYISPQLWAWRKYRKRTIKKYVDLLITILPFEKDWYTSQGILNVEYAGSPLAKEVRADTNRTDFRRKHAIPEDARLIALLPGSRNTEITHILPVMLETAALMFKRDDRMQFIIAAGSPGKAAEVEKVIQASGEISRVLKSHLNVVCGETFDALNASDAASVTSGTATLETGIIGTPMAIVYKASAFNYKLMRPMISVEHFGLINLIAGERLVKELIQDDFTAGKLAEEMFRILELAENQRLRKRLAEVADTLGHGGASKRAAEAVLRVIDGEVEY